MLIMMRTEKELDQAHLLQDIFRKLLNTSSSNDIYFEHTNHSI